MSKTFPFFGTATNNKGEFSVRGAADNDKRVIAMTKAGLSNIVLVQLPVAMLKLDACKHIQSLPEFASAGQQAAIQQYIANNDDAPSAPAQAPAPAPVVETAPKAKKAPKTTKAPKPVAEVLEEPAVEEQAAAPESTDAEPEVSDKVYDNKIVDLGDDEFGSDDDFGLGDYAGMVDNYDYN